MWNRNSIGEILLAILVFLIGVFVGGVVAGIIACGPLGRDVVLIVQPGNGSFERFLLWALFGLVPLTVAAALWNLVVLILVWVLSPVPVSMRFGPRTTSALGVAAAACAVFALTFSEVLGTNAGLIAASLVVVISPLLLVKGDTRRNA